MSQTRNGVLIVAETFQVMAGFYVIYNFLKYKNTYIWVHKMLELRKYAQATFR